jgi:hypothetical protein
LIENALLAAAPAALVCLAPSGGAASPYPVTGDNLAVSSSAAFDVVCSPKYSFAPSSILLSMSTDAATTAPVDGVFARDMENVAVDHSLAALPGFADHAPGQADGPGADAAAASGTNIGFSDTASPLSSGQENGAGGVSAPASSPASATPPAAATHVPPPAITQPPPLLAAPALAAPSVSAPPVAAPAASSQNSATAGASQAPTPGAPPASGAPTASLYDAGNLLSSVAGTTAPQPSAYSGFPVRYNDGIVELSFTDLPGAIPVSQLA